MALMKCGECQGKVSSAASSCPHCGAPVHAGPPPKKKKGTLRYLAELFAAGFAVFIGLGIVVGLSDGGGASGSGPHVLVLGGKTPIGWMKSSAICEIERATEFPSPDVSCIPANKAPAAVPQGGSSILRASGQEGSTVAATRSVYARYAPGIYPLRRCRARAAHLSARGAKGSLGVVSLYSCK